MEERAVPAQRARGGGRASFSTDSWSCFYNIVLCFRSSNSRGEGGERELRKTWRNLLVVSLYSIHSSGFRIARQQSPDFPRPPVAHKKEGDLLTHRFRRACPCAGREPARNLAAAPIKRYASDKYAAARVTAMQSFQGPNQSSEFIRAKRVDRANRPDLDLG